MQKPVHLTQIEYKLVSLLAQNNGRVLTYDYILKSIWGPYADADNQILRVNMANIRRKLERNPAEPKYIFTEIGVGYRMRENEDVKDIKEIKEIEEKKEPEET
jgi:two-component system KDP operon response regulator KdpE